MKIIEMEVGSPEWIKSFSASKAPAMMGASSYKSRSQLIREMATGITPDIDAGTQARFDAGHDAEEKARAIIESQIGVELFPVTCVETVDGIELLASLDGLPMDESFNWECKLWNQKLSANVAQDLLEPNYYWQLEQQLLVTGAGHALFTVSNGTPENTLSMEYRSVPERRAALIAGWKQFAADVAAYQHVEVALEVTGKAPESLPALRIELTGMVTASNLTEFKAHALAVFSGIKTDLQTDDDFANAEKTAKWCAEVKNKLFAAKEHALSQTASIDAVFKAIDSIIDESDRVRLDLGRQVKTQKDNRRAQIIIAGRAKLAEHIAALNNRLGKPYMPAIAEDFAGAIKGKAKLSSIQDAIDTELARCKIEASAIADKLQANLKTLVEMASDCKSLFTDTAQIIHKSNDDLVALIKARVADNKAEIEAKEARRIAAQELADQAERVRIEFAEAKAKKAAEEAAVKAEAPVIEAAKPNADFPCVHKAGTGAPMPIIAEAAITTLAVDQAFNEFIKSNTQRDKIYNQSAYDVAQYFFNAGFLAGKAL